MGDQDRREYHQAVRRLADEANLPRRPLTEEDFEFKPDPTGNFGFPSSGGVTARKA